MRNHISGRVADINSLTRRETEVLLLVSQGHCSKKIAKVLEKEDGASLSPGTIKQYRRNLLYKFNAVNSVDLMTKAFPAGFEITAQTLEKLKNSSALKFIALSLSGFLFASDMIKTIDLMERLRHPTVRIRIVRTTRNQIRGDLTIANDEKLRGKLC